MKRTIIVLGLLALLLLAGCEDYTPPCDELDNNETRCDYYSCRAEEENLVPRINIFLNKAIDCRLQRMEAKV